MDQIGRIGVPLAPASRWRGSTAHQRLAAREGLESNATKPQCQAFIGVDWLFCDACQRGRIAQRKGLRFGAGRIR
jgi:hypothetical protein